MVVAESQFQIPETEEVTLVSQRKYNLDKECPWWEKLYFRLVFLPVVRFGFRWMHIAAPAAMRPDGTIELIEQMGVYSDPLRAASAVKNQYYCTKPLPFDVELDERSFQYKGHRYPLSVMPDRYRRRTHPLTVVTNEAVELANRANKELDTLLQTTRY
jgi:hypothetical protein